jgi:hypothetical protein
MKRLLVAAVALGAIAFAGAAQAGWPYGGDPHFAGYRHDHFDRRYLPPPTVRYYSPPVIYPAPVLYAPQTVCATPPVYGPYVRPANNVAFFGRNFGVQFNW